MVTEVKLQSSVEVKVGHYSIVNDAMTLLGQVNHLFQHSYSIPNNWIHFTHTRSVINISGLTDLMNFMIKCKIMPQLLFRKHR